MSHGKHRKHHRGEATSTAHARRLLRLRLDPDVEVDAVAVDDGLTVADLRLGDDPVSQHRVPLERNFERERNLHASVREVETRVVSASDHGPMPGVRRR
jgi:hypothetical protein